MGEGERDDDPGAAGGDGAVVGGARAADSDAVGDDRAVDETRSATASSPAASSDGTPAARRIGRFHVLEELGSGGMGVVLAAYDPALERKVAIKLLHPDRLFGAATRGRAQLVAEAQAMARLSHPNVVAVHEIAFEHDAAYLVMEYVAGPTLRRWLAEGERTWREVLALLIGAGEGLVAAHREGIVHRDFKPENVLIDRDGRARVGDFGIATVVDGERRAAGSGGISGTLRYMAPEQLRGEPCDARADQFSYCVTLWEALHGNRPFAGTRADELRAVIEAGTFREPQRKSPDWVRAALRRGLQGDPAARWPSLAALLAALRRDPRVRRRWIAGAAAVIAAGTAALTLWPSVAPVDPCGGAEARLVGVWDAPRKISVHAAFAATGLGYAEDTWRAVRDRLDRYAAAWTGMATEACRATRVEGRQSDTLMDLRMGCLEQRRHVLGELAALWARGVDRDVLSHAVDAAGGVAPLADCADARGLGDRAAMPSAPAQVAAIAAARTQLDALHALVLAHRLPDAKRSAPAVQRAADATGWAPLRAEAAFAEGALLSELGEPAAEARLVEANQLADTAGDDRLRARILIRLVADLGGQQQKIEAASRMAAVAEGVVARVGEDDALRGRLLHARGKLLLTAGSYAEARAALDDARARLTRALGAADAETVATVDDLARTAHAVGDYATARRLGEENLAVATPVLGAAHPQVAVLLTNLATTLIDGGDSAAAAAAYRRALAIDEQVFGPDAAPTALTLNDLARVEYRLRHYEEALRLNERALAIRQRTLGPDHPQVATSLGNVAIEYARQGKFDLALPQLERALAIKIKAYGPSHAKVVQTLLQIAQVHETKRDLEHALAMYRRALEVSRVASGPDHDVTIRMVGRVAYVLAQLHRCREARPLFDQAIVAMSKSDIYNPTLADTLSAAAECDLGEHQPAAALARMDRALVLADKIDAEPAARGALHWMQWRALVALARRADATAAAKQALQEMTGDADSTVEQAAMRAWLAGKR